MIIPGNLYRVKSNENELFCHDSVVLFLGEEGRYEEFCTNCDCYHTKIHLKFLSKDQVITWQRIYSGKDDQTELDDVFEEIR